MSSEISSAGVTLISQGTGYGLLIGLGILFCGVILIAVKIQKAYLDEDSGTSEMFMVANRSVGTGLTASAVFSSWMWINETVFSAVFCYRFGLAGPMWYGSGLCFQIALMAALGVLAKLRVPYAHTSLEIIRLRYGKAAHVVFLVLNLCCNIFGCASMILTGSQLIHGIAGIHFVAATILIPLGVVLYTAVGGLKATFLTDYLHTAVALILIIYFTLSILSHEAIGGLYGLYDKVTAVAPDNYIPGNYQGSLLTMKSHDAIIWGLILKFGNLALVVMDTAFWQKSFATEVNATVPGYNLAAVAIFGVPWGLGTVVGLAARAIHDTPLFPTWPGEFTQGEILSGFVMPYAIQALLGTQGVVAFFVLVFMALTSTVSSSMIAVSSILSFDLYKTYINPAASDRRIIRVSHLSVAFHAVFITGFSIVLNYGGANMTWIGYFRPILTSSGILPLILTLTWSRQTRLAATWAPILGFVSGLAVWLATAKSMYGSITLATTMKECPSLYGSIAACCSPALYSLLLSAYRPSTFDWREFLRITAVTQSEPSPDNTVTTSAAGSTTDTTPPSPNEKPPIKTATATTTETDDLVHPLDKQTLAHLARWYRIAWATFGVLVLLTFVAWPLPLYRDYIFGRAFFAGWTTVAIAWQFFAFGAVVVYPVYDGRWEIWRGVRGVMGSVGGWFKNRK
ncbi:sodium:solute symporter family protein [Aspergillus candidus]|uniref:Sodium:solute symporter family-domain-containing protein n=1 Tax=Aspergillus candidus TaxID=41067 RepID=A0A2I2EY17_ASPCN|nr:Sodium:solute symporter family-domain-containing protein [Aspergillus candidus]PLB33273.1 Sodium:solute symporter family-domain-containing protein [Aspergillus candidus]